MKNLKEEVTKEEMKRAKTALISLVIFASIMIIVGIVSGIIIAVMQERLRKLEEENKQLENELEELFVFFRRNK